MYIHGIDVYIPLCRILSKWSEFQMRDAFWKSVWTLDPASPTHVSGHDRRPGRAAAAPGAPRPRADWRGGWQPGGPRRLYS